MCGHAKEALRLNLCSFCSPGKLTVGAKAERSKIIKNSSLAKLDENCVELDKEQPETSLTGKGYGPVNALKIFKVGASHDLFVQDQRPIDKAWPVKWESMNLSDLAALLQG